MVTLPVSWVEDFPVREPFVTVHGVQFGPLKDTRALLESKPLPLMVKVKACPAMGDVGDVVTPLSWGAADEVESVICCPLEAGPVEPFCTITVNVPAFAILTVPIN